jgi:thiol:disulfide interchange protein
MSDEKANNDLPPAPPPPPPPPTPPSSFGGSQGGQYSPAGIPNNRYGEVQAPLNTASLIGFILAMANFVFPLLWLPALISGIIGYRQIKKSGERGMGFAITAIIIGGLITLVFLFLIIAAVISSSS